MRNISAEIEALKARVAQIKREQRKLTPGQVEHYTNRLELDDLLDDIKELKALNSLEA